MKKDECISKFVASLIIAFPFMAMFAFLVELFGIETFIEISKNHGSLIAGIIGIIGVFILVWNQNKSTRQTVEATLKAIHVESKEIERRVSKESIFKIIDRTNKIYRSQDTRDIQFEIHGALDELVKLNSMVNRNVGDIEKIRLLFIQDTLILYLFLIKHKESEFYSARDFHMLFIKNKHKKLLEYCEKIKPADDDDDKYYQIQWALDINFFEEIANNHISIFAHAERQVKFKLNENSLVAIKGVVSLLKWQLLELSSYVDGVNLYK